ncbi:hypothetical protein Ciccas_001983 [Cichlidogyrus casuarinus]|uniref:Uncharacterized protein n=1 Tax=Cichlidogyrus casuarinus TaxID=1844966 RepID=A0ABD2QIK0_9PLAT
MRHLIFVFLSVTILLEFIKAEDCPYEVFGEIPDTLATVAQVKAFNSLILPLIQSLLLTDFFKFYKVSKVHQ